MTTVRRVIREKAFQSLFQLSTHDELTADQAIRLALESTLSFDEGRTIEEAMKDALPEEKNTQQIVTDALHYLRRLVVGTRDNKEVIDETITRHLKNWSLNRLERTNRLLLELAAYELLFEAETDKRIVMNEAIELAKTFNDEKASKFINGVLQSIVDENKV
ncbi:transcription antitermination factor NusB [Alkalibacterium pelagium]|uniref:Transcription antitermination protein NusB n=1 Tax=Alkalibacterium pelagium TaxID=426702 RepID=A0A1H7N256_9LACT|nr:transcription antitermination factor NusB [Alkalibacterium pelagium]GEN51296.1 N utilization substance protein B [Alkalibacterium pelagium]SEL17590.1 NusB antitermination factor [Alkalibacterium pelagium]